MPFTMDQSRQFPLVAVAEMTLADLPSGESVNAISLPPGAVVIGGDVVITQAFDSGDSDTVIVGDSVVNNRYANALDAQSAARTALTITGYRNPEKEYISVRNTAAGTAATEGALRLTVMYVVEQRASEVQE